MSFAHWRKCDFQIHTPRDPNWQGARPIGLNEDLDGTPATADDVDNAREAWANTFVDMCIEKGLEAVALTDHHEMVMVSYVQKIIEERKATNPHFDLWLFPGMELTAHSGVQCIILFDADLSEDWRRQAQGKLGIVYADLEEKSTKSPKVTQLTCAYPDIGPELDKLGAGIIGKYVVLPNVSQGGQHTVLTSGRHADFKRMPYVGGYLDHAQSIDTLLAANKQRLSGNDSMWGLRHIYPLPTSDSRSSDYTTLGDNSCWIKLAAPTAEAIRQAFLGYQSRITITRPSIASLSLVSMRLVGSTILHDATLELSPELNSFIGGRGSGKSSILEYLAFALGRSCDDLAKTDYSGSDRMSSLIRDTLTSAGGEIHVTLSQDGALFTISRTGGNAYQPQVTYPNGSIQPLSTRELRSLFPAIVYSQGELSELGKQAGKKTQLSELLQFVNPDFKKEDEKLSANIEVAKRAVSSAIQNLSASWRQQSELHKLETEKASLEQRILALQKTLPALSPADQEIVAKFESLTSFEGSKSQATTQVETVMAQLTDLWKLGAQPLDVSSALLEARPFIDSYEAFKTEFVDGLKALGQRLATKKSALDGAGETWTTALQTARVARDGVMEKLGEHKTVTAQISTLQQEVETATAQIGNLKLNMTSADEQSKVVNNAIDDLKAAVTDRGERTAAWALQIENLSNGRIKADLNVDGDWSEVRDAIDIVSAKTGSQEASRQRQIGESISSSSVWQYLDTVRSECLAVLHYKQIGSSLKGDQPSWPELLRTIGGTERTHANCIEMMDLARVEAIAIAAPKPDISLSYCDDGRKISFEKASEGQRAAALLFMLLEQPGGPLLVDQPEGDLDNKVISDLTDRLHESKQKRQILFASHNANIVVNGSSELVSYLEMKNDGKRQFECAGAIDQSEICQTITATMEGGEKAFRDRQNKYGY
ncbi:TrlF family AAA-like ATPase [Pontixanthobacter sp.]|uniref:TrlF family AAA-like ATPase n=1 Tax=Pontixanthobacter sp. TaxID=2792078 RepID=UPI003C7BBDA7